MPARLSRAAYADMFGPTTGDKVRLADTDLVVEVERDFAIYGEEVKFGGGKVIRDGMGQGQAARADGADDTVITNALIVDHWGIVKADVGLKDGKIAAIGKAGNPDTQPGVDIIVGPGTEAANTRGGISKASMVHNAAMPDMAVDPETYEVRADGALVTCAPAEVLPMAQRYFLF